MYIVEVKSGLTSNVWVHIENFNNLAFLIADLKISELSLWHCWQLKLRHMWDFRLFLLRRNIGDADKTSAKVNLLPIESHCRLGETIKIFGGVWRINTQDHVVRHTRSGFSRDLPERERRKDLLLGPDLYTFLVLFSPLGLSAIPKAPKTTAYQVVTAGFKQLFLQSYSEVPRQSVWIWEVHLSDGLPKDVRCFYSKMFVDEHGTPTRILLR